MRTFGRSYEDFVTEQVRGEIHGVFIDDTGSPGLRNTPHGLHPERKSWVAVIIPRAVMPEVWRQFPGALEELQVVARCREFHFANIYMGRGPFKRVAWNERMGIFRFMVYLFERYELPVLVQTLDPTQLADWHSMLTNPAEKVGLFDFTKHEDLALFVLLVRVKEHLSESFQPADRLARVFVDEGFKKDGRAMLLTPFADTFADGLVCFARSDVILPIQLADFAAFCLNRSQLLLYKAKLEPRDREFLEITSPIARNYRNLEHITVGWPKKQHPRE